MVTYCGWDVAEGKIVAEIWRSARSNRWRLERCVISHLQYAHEQVRLQPQNGVDRAQAKRGEKPNHMARTRPSSRSMIGDAHGFQSNDRRLMRARHFDSGTQATTAGNAQKRSWGAFSQAICQMRPRGRCEKSITVKFHLALLDCY